MLRHGRLLQVMDIRQQANDALQQASTEIAEAEQAAAHAHQQASTVRLICPLLTTHCV